MFTRILTAFALLAACTTTAMAAEHSKDGDAQIKAALADKSAVMIDVREIDEWNAGHLKDAINVPLSDIKAGKLSAVPKGKILYLHCKSGRRSLIAADLLKDAKFSDVRALADGYDALAKKGY